MKKNNIPFLLLALVHVCMLIVLFKKKKKYTWILLISNMGFAYLFEYFILNLFQGYRYKPKFMKQPYFDNIFGAILSQGIYVPITATFVTMFRLNFIYKIGFCIYFYMIEKLFIKLKVYSLNWWKPSFTFITLILYFYLSDGFYTALRDRKNWILYTATFLSIEVISVTFMFYLAVFRKIRFGRGHLYSWREHFIIAPLYSLLITTLSVVLSSKPGLVYRSLLISTNIFIDLILKSKDILKTNFKKGLGILPLHFLMMIISRFLYIKIVKQS
ncbi:hypothetical protein JOC85_003826 [Bacillus mesophilus]|nr:hypothetical protein [Bacillus mesophilus]